jgi:cell division protein FtsW
MIGEHTPSRSWVVHSPWILLLFAVVVLTSLGLSAIYSASQSFQDSAYLILRKQIIWLGLSIVACMVVSRVNLDWLREHALLIYILTVLGLIVVLIPGIGIKVNGAQRWLGLGPVRIQVSEFAKLGLVFTLSHYLAVNQREIRCIWKGFLMPCILIGIVFALIMKEPDYGTAFLCALVGMTLLFLAGCRLRFLLPCIALGLAGFSAMVYHDPVRLRRVVSYLDVEANRADSSYQLYQGIMAFRAGGIEGVGLGQGRQQMSFLPEAHTDFIFAIIGEERGLIYTTGIVIVFLAIFLLLIFNAKRSPNLFHYCLITGGCLIIVFQALINVGVVTGCLPTKGMSLPFISYGGSNLMTMFILLGVFINIFRTWNKPAITEPREL